MMMWGLTSGMMQEQRQTELITRNLGGASIPRFKREYLFTQAYHEASAGADEQPHQLRGAKAGDTMIDFSQGDLKETGRTLDFALMGDNVFFECKAPDGRSIYTRSGSFFASKDSRLITSEGYKVSTSNGSIKFNKEDNLDRVEVCLDGSVRIRDERNKDYVQELGQLRIVKIDDPQKLTKLSGKYFMANPDNPPKTSTANPDDYQVVNRTLEMANLSPILEMTNMIASYRRYEIESKFLKTTSETYSSEVRNMG